MNDFDTSSASSSAASASAFGSLGRQVRTGQARVIALDHTASLSLAAARHDRVIQLEHGQLWLTCTRRALSPTRPRVGAGQIDPASADVAGRDQSDIWLTAGDSVHLPAGSHWVLQAWPEARLSLCAVATSRNLSAPPATRANRHGWQHRLMAAAQRLLHKHSRPVAAQAGVGLTGTGCS